MISAGDFRNGVTVEIDGNVCQIVEFQHVNTGERKSKRLNSSQITKSYTEF